jgi:hypothetical protein
LFTSGSLSSGQKYESGKETNHHFNLKKTGKNFNLFFLNFALDMFLFQNEIFEQMACAFDGIPKSQAGPGEALFDLFGQ